MPSSKRLSVRAQYRKLHRKVLDRIAGSMTRVDLPWQSLNVQNRQKSRLRRRPFAFAGTAPATSVCPIALILASQISCG